MTRPVILAYGDSNTHGTTPMTSWGERGRLDPGQRWPDLLAAELGDVTMIAEGHPGRTTVHDDPVEGTHKNGLTVLPAILETHRPIDLIILMLGTNDLKARFSLGPDDIARSVDRLAGVIRTSEAGPGGAAPGLVIVCPAPILETGRLKGIFRGGRTTSLNLDPPIKAVAEARGAGYLDAGTVAEVSDIDGIHLTTESHAALARALAPVVRKTLGRG